MMRLRCRHQSRAASLCMLVLLAAISASAQAQSPQLLLTVNDPLFGDQWNLYDASTTNQAITPDIQAMAAWQITTGTPETIIAILDSGIDLDHRDLRDKIWINADETPDNGLDDDGNGKVDDYNGWDFVDNDPQPEDEVGWGTFMAGITGAATNNNTGIASVAWRPRIMPVRVLNRNNVGQATARLADLIAGIGYAVENGARIIQLGFYIEEPLLTESQRASLEAALASAYEAGVLIVAPVGDRGLAGNPRTFPAAFPTVIGVTATDRNKQRLEAAGHGTFVEIAAPGVNLLGPLPDDRYGQGGTGTEFAVSHVAGLAALMWAVNPTLTPTQIRDFVRDSADDLGPLGYDEFYGFGLLNAGAALQMTPHLLQIRPQTLHFRVDENGTLIPPTQTISNPYTSGLTWQARSNVRWLQMEGLSDSTPSSLTISIDPTVVPNCGQYTGEILVESNQPQVANASQSVTVTLEFARATCERARLPLIHR